MNIFQHFGQIYFTDSDESFAPGPTGRLSFPRFPGLYSPPMKIPGTPLATDHSSELLKVSVKMWETNSIGVSQSKFWGGGASPTSMVYASQSVRQSCPATQ